MLNWIKSLFGSNAEEIKKFLDQNHKVIDVRTEGEFRAGHMKGSINIPLQKLGNHLDEIRAMEQPVILCCKSGTRSGIAKGQLRKAGIEAINGGTWKSLDNLSS